MIQDASGYRFWKAGSAASPYSTAAQIRYPWVALQQPRGWQVYYKTPSQPVSRYFDSLQFAGPVLVCTGPDSTYVYFNHSRSLTFTGRPKVWFRPGTDSLFYVQVDLPEGKALYNAQGQHLFTADVQQILYAGEGYFEATRNNKKGLLGPAGNWVIPAGFDALGPVQNGWVSTLRNNRFGMWNLTIQKEIRPEYDNNLIPYTGSLLVAARQNARGLINWENKPKVPFQFDEVLYWTDTVLLVRKNFQWILFNRITQKTVMDHIQSFTWVKNTPADKTIIFLRDGYYGVVGSRSGIILQPTFTRVLNLGTEEDPFYFTEKYIEEAGIYVVIYYDRQGRLVHRQVLEEDEYETLRCNR
ncbi:MAG: hypothetical protein KatS3mg032_2251 [Cyclobacteriaceae bacterium]|nr:MAG: hypothetical protein KatS3mg032_2251 [Cyclobacteriaceae bacterium]